MEKIRSGTYISSLSNIREKLKSDFSFLFKKLREKEWDFLQNFLVGIIGESLYSAVAFSLYPLGLFELESNNFSGKEGGKNPVLLVHGYGMNRSNFLILQKRLKKAGFEEIYTINLKTHKHYIEEMAEDLKGKIDLIYSLYGMRVCIISHSLGGLVSRYYIQFLEGYKKVNLLITLGTPHQGTEFYIFGPFKSAYQMNPRGEMIRKLNEENLHLLEMVKIYSIWSPFDYAVLPPEFAKVPHPSASNIKVDFVGHLGLLFNHRVGEIIKFLLKKHLEDNKNEKRRGSKKTLSEKGIFGEKI